MLNTVRESSLYGCLVVLWLMHPTMQFTFLAVRAHCRLILSLLSPALPHTFLLSCSPATFSPSFYICWDYVFLFFFIILFLIAVSVPEP